ncbi:MAG: formate/nitrite transporter family protein [Acidobacteria bacterium]|nr:formate/nitrite transporter family protein [Acidobacteriota bacterium]
MPEVPGENSKRLSAGQIFEAAVATARQELKRSSRALAFSGLAGGLTMGLTGLAVSSVHAIVGAGGWSDLAGFLFYPVGFIAVIIGRGQLFTENTLYPVILLLDERSRAHFTNTARLWAVVFASNIAGASAFAALAVLTGALRPNIVGALVTLGQEALAQSSARVFWSGVLGGWLIALVAWIVTASHWTIGQLAMTWLLTFVVGVARLSHCIATSGEALSAVIHGSAAFGTYAHWLLLATLGNIVGGVVIVSLLNYGQVKEP